MIDMMVLIAILLIICALYILSTICRRGEDRMGALYDGNMPIEVYMVTVSLKTAWKHFAERGKMATVLNLMFIC